MIGRMILLTVGLALAGPAVRTSAASIQADQPQPAPIPLLAMTIVARHPHDPNAFTEGLVWHRGALYESVGMAGRSEVRRVRLADGAVTARAKIDPGQFGEGLADWHDDLVSLTWHDGIAYRWDARTLRRKGRALHYAGEGWGLASDGDSLVMSDGTPVLRFFDPVTLAERRRVTVTVDGRPLHNVNELEFVRGALLANVWHQDFIVRIAPDSGRVTGVIDLRPLIAEVRASDPEAVPNGIAWDAQADRLFVTGKLWPTLYEIRLTG